MPKASTSPGSQRASLRRNQACRSCRKRKLKCDAARPHCGTCVKQWQALISVPPPVGYTHPIEPQCSYDPVEGLSLAPETDPMEKIRLLENEVAQLKIKLHEHQKLDSFGNNSYSFMSPGAPHASSSASPALPHSLPSAGGILLPRASLDVCSLATSQSPEPKRIGLSASPQLKTSPSSDPFMELLYSGWNPDLPEPSLLNHYIETFFKCDPCGSRVLHRPSFLASMMLSPRDAGFPHSAILHAICASASRWTTNDMMTMPDGTKRDRFADFHASKTRQYIDKTMAHGTDIFAVMQACILLSWYFYQEGRWVEVWVFAGFQTRVAIPLRLNFPGAFTVPGPGAPGAYLGPPTDYRDLESRRRTWWMTIMFDRIASVGGWIHAVDEQDIGTEFPLRSEDFESELEIASNPQHIQDPDLFVRHPAQYTDSFILFMKACLLFGKVTDFNVRNSLHPKGSPSKHQNPFYLDGFEFLDKTVCGGFLDSLPQIYKNNFGVSDTPTGSMLDTDLYMVHLVPHAAAITLHNPFIDFMDIQSVSAARCVNAARSILAAYYMLSATSLDISRLHPFVTICWYLAAVVQVHLCKYFIEIGDSDREAVVWGEINVLRCAMLEYGRRSPIGTKQEKLLQGLMREIVRMTGQKQPLEVGVPLFPFSHAGVFGGNNRARHDGDESIPPAPLPVSPEFDVA